MGKQPDEHPSVRCFKLLFQHCTEGTIYLHFLPSGKNLFVPLNKISSIPEILQKHKEESCYFGIGTRKNEDHSKEGIIKIPALWVEIRSEVSSEKWRELEESPLKLKPTFWVKFAGGYHVYFLFKKPTGPSEIATVENLNQRLAIHLKPFMANLNGCDVDRTLPVPGTPEPGKKLKVYFYRVHPERQYTIHDFDKNLPALPMASPVGPSSVPRREKEAKSVSVEVKPKFKPSEESKWNDYLKQSKEWYILVRFELLHSKAYTTLKQAPALKLLFFMNEKIRREKVQGKKGKKHFKVRDEGKFSFTYKEANHRGLSDIQFTRALKELYSHGLLEVHHPGSSLKGDFSVYSLSERWKQFGQPGFEKKEFPTSVHRIKSGFKRGHAFLWERKKSKANQ